MSHPVWVRGLKQIEVKKENEKTLVAPRVGAWIETIACVNRPPLNNGRTPCGCVD